MGHGGSDFSLCAESAKNKERALIGGIVKTITTGTGKAPRGWLGPALHRDP